MDCLRAIRIFPLLCLYAAFVCGSELPTAPTVVHGDVAHHIDGSNLMIDPASDHGIVHNSFGIGAGSGVFVNQPSSSAALLERVAGVNPSMILGVLRANGIFYLENANGVVFGQNVRIDVNREVSAAFRRSSDRQRNQRQRLSAFENDGTDRNRKPITRQVATVITENCGDRKGVEVPTAVCDPGHAMKTFTDDAAGGLITLDFSEVDVPDALLDRRDLAQNGMAHSDP